MEKQSCFVCSSHYEVPSRKAHILICCHKKICNECLIKNYSENKICPNCQKPVIQRQLADFPLDIEIEKKSNFEKLESTKFNQCQENQEDGQDNATKICNECGSICIKCYDNHTSMNILRTHKIGSMPIERLPDDLNLVLTECVSCEHHRDKAIESFCKNCRKAVCEKCIVESHRDCKSNICTIDNEVDEIITNLQKSLHDNVADVKRVENIRSKAMGNQKTIEDNMKMIKQWSGRCSEILKNTTEEVEILYQNKANGLKQTHEKFKERLQEISASQGQVQRFINSATSVPNKVEFVRTAHKVRESIQNFQNDVIKIEREVHEAEDRKADYQYADFVKTFCSKLNDDSISDKLSSTRKGSDYSMKCRRQNNGMVQDEENKNEKRFHAKVFDDKRENSIMKFQVKYKKDMFPRYMYHLELIQKIVDREQEIHNRPEPKSSKNIELLYKRETDEEPEHTVDPENENKDVSALLQSNIFVYGRTIDEIRKLLHPLELQEPTGNEHLENVILVAFSDEIDADLKTSFYSTIQEKMNKCCWCILVTSESDDEKFLKRLPDRKFSVVPPNTDDVWNHLTSAMELKLIEFLNAKSRNMEMPLSIREDVKTVLRRIEKCSAIKQNCESNEIPKSIQDVLERFGDAIDRYGFNFDKFRVVVKNKRFNEVNEALHETGLYDSFPINVIREDELMEKITPFNLQSQGRELFNTHDQDEYGTLGCLALMNNITVALTCKHVCNTNENAYIFNEQNPRIILGKCLYTSNDESKLDFAVIKVIRNIEQTYFRNKKLLNCDKQQTNARMYSSNNFDFLKEMQGEIVHKIGAKTDVTQGKIVATECINKHNQCDCINKVNQRIKVRGMNGKVFGEKGDSGSIVFREIFGAKERYLEVIAMVLGGSQDEDTDIVCTMLQTAIDHIKSLHGDMPFTFFNE